MSTWLISAAELLKVVQESPQDVRIVDTSSPDEFAKGHIPNSVNVNQLLMYLMESSTEPGLKEFQQYLAKLLGDSGVSGKEKTLVVCEGTMKIGSPRGAFLLRYLGASQAKLLHGGLDSWRAAGGSVVTEDVKIPPTTFQLNVKAEMMATKSDVLAVVTGSDTTGAKLLDDRDIPEWLGNTTDPYEGDRVPRTGRIQTAKWLLWTELVKDDDTTKAKLFKDRSSVQEIVKSKVGMLPDDNIIVYCYKGARASNTLIAMAEAGFTRLRVYVGSWNEWGRLDELPIDGTPLSSAA